MEEKGGILLYEFAGNGPVGRIDVLGLINWQFSGAWDPAQQADVAGSLALIQRRLPQLQARLLQLRQRMDALPDYCPLKALLLAGYQTLNRHVGDLGRKLASTDVVEIDEHDFDPSDGNYAATHGAGIGLRGRPPWIWVPFDHISINTRAGYYFDADPDVRTETLFHELLHLPGIRLGDPGPQDPFSNPGSIEFCISNPTGFGLGPSIRDTLWQQVLGPNYRLQDRARLEQCCGPAALDSIFQAQRP